MATQPALNEAMRAILVDWLVDVHKAAAQKLWVDEKAAAEAGFRFAVNLSYFEPQ